MHSFWDTFFILRGLKDAAYLADAVGEKELSKKWQALADDFRTSLIDSIRLTQKAHGIDYLPGCVELGDFDSTSSTILVWPVDEAANLPRAWIDATFDRYWREFVNRRDQSPATWEAYTPYELRHVGVLVRLGQKDRAWQALNFYLGYQRPAGWREWAEVVWRVPSTPRVIGDMPHTWCGSDFLNSARAMFVYEDESSQSLKLFAGLPEEWLSDPAGVSFRNLGTEFGPISASAKLVGADRILLHIEGAAHPSGGFEVPSPLNRPIRSIKIGGKQTQVTDAASVHFTNLPAEIELTY
jgi:hypothetical protein